jgi:GH35 family endo-1,4-beta-xylanase
MRRRSFLKTASAGVAALALPRSWSAEPASAGGDDPALIDEAKARIEQHRKGDGLLVVRDDAGRPVPGARVVLEQQRHEFLFGCNCFLWGRCKEPQQEEAYRRRFADLLNFATLGFYWSNYEPERGKPNYAYTDEVVAWTRTQGLASKGHPLVWDWLPDPKWLPGSFPEIASLSQGRVREIVARYQGRIDTWDVVNEPTHLGRNPTRMADWAKSLGARPYVAAHLKAARAANPRATLLVNDYRTDPPFFDILRDLREDGRWLFDAVGLQSHMHDGGWPLRRVWEVGDVYARLGLPLHFTETTVVSGPRLGPGEKWGPTTPEGEERQADYVPKFYMMVFAHPSTQALTWWDFSDQAAWQGAAAGLLRADMSPKPVYERLLELIRGEWWTHARGTTDAQGQFSTRAFFGTYRVDLELPSGRKRTQELRWQRGQTNRFELSA